MDKMRKDRSHMLAELVNSVESIEELMALDKTMREMFPIKYRMLEDMGDIDRGIGDGV